MKKITKLVLPIAGLGKRLLPLTAHTPKSLILVNGKPLIEYVLEEAVASGIREVVLVVNPKNKPDFAAYIKKNGKNFPTLKFHVRVQETPGGNGHAIAKAYDVIGNDPFAVRFCDDVLLGNPPALRGLIDIFNKYHASVLLLERVPMKMVSRFGVIGFDKKKHIPPFLGGKLYQLTKIVEKPKAKDAPSNLTVIGGYVLTPEVLNKLKLVSDTLGIISDDALPIAVGFQIELMVHGKIYGWEFPGRRLDCGTLATLQEAKEILRKQ